MMLGKDIGGCGGMLWDIHFVSAGDDGDDVDGLLYMYTFMTMSCGGSWELMSDSLSIKAMALRSPLLCYCKSGSISKQSLFRLWVKILHWTGYFLIIPTR